MPQERTPALERYLRIAATLSTKGARDVALRVRWMQRFAQQKRRVSCNTRQRQHTAPADLPDGDQCGRRLWPDSSITRQGAFQPNAP